MLPMISWANKTVKIDNLWYYLYESSSKASVTLNPDDKNDKYRGDIVIPATVSYEGVVYNVQYIEYGAFGDCEELSSVAIPNSVTYIGPSAFCNCTSLTSVDIPNSVTGIGSSAFYACTSLTSVAIPNSVIQIGSSAFEGCSGLSNISLTEGLEKIDYAAFAYCTSLTSLFIPKGVKSIAGTTIGYQSYIKGVSIVTGCKKLTSIVVDKENITYDSRDNCNAIIETASNRLIVGCVKSVIPQGVKYLSIEAFQDCEELESLYLPSTLFDDPDMNLSNNRLGMYFSGCTNLRSITVDENNPRIDSRDNCNAIIETATDKLILGCKETVIPNSVKAIGSNAFFHFDKLLNRNSLLIDNNIEMIEAYAFWGCMLENIIVKNPQTQIHGGSFSEPTLQHAILYVPAGQRWDAIYGNGGWYRFNNIREIAMESRELSEARAYTLMNTNDFSLAVYDAVNGEVANASSLYDIDENNASNAWQIIKGDDDNYLYNIGARQYAGIDADGKIVLSSSPVAISLHETKNGFTLGDNNGQQWGFVINENVKPYKDLSAIDNITSTAIRDAYYTLDGQRLSQVKKGLNIVRTSDGQAKKVIIK